MLAVDASREMVELARQRLGDRAQVCCRDVLDLQLDGDVDAIVSTATLHWVRDHERLWPTLARALRGAGRWRPSAAARATSRACARRSTGLRASWPRSCWASRRGTSPRPEETEQRLRRAGFEQVRCWLEPRPTEPEDPAAFIRTSILAAHLERLPAPRREPFAAAVAENVRLPLDYVRLNISAKRAILG